MLNIERRPNVDPRIEHLLSASQRMGELGETLAGRLLLVDAATAEFREVRVERDPACRACGDR